MCASLLCRRTFHFLLLRTKGRVTWQKICRHTLFLRSVINARETFLLFGKVRVVPALVYLSSRKLLTIAGREQGVFQKILIAYDGSNGSKRALDMAIELTKVSQAELWALAVEEHLPRYPATISETEAEKEVANQYYHQCLRLSCLS